MTPKEQSMLEELLDKESGLSGTEIDFLDDLSGDTGRSLSQKQADWLELIYNRVCK
jgi:hypothetical protein